MLTLFKYPNDWFMGGFDLLSEMLYSMYFTGMFIFLDVLKV